MKHQHKKNVGNIDIMTYDVRCCSNK